MDVGHPQVIALGALFRKESIDEDTAIQVVDGSVDVISEGRWRRWD